ncbi:FecR family protein [Hydrogenophaga sp. NFH-34]|uniref:FecR family protein n=1 Tax=Hydrogenophaga sp. NFH-34 TaxID=2744446 RepID=UPI001F1C65E4|nr:FecR family protein [Hydrogenophaga sp. NFH-34]
MSAFRLRHLATTLVLSGGLALGCAWAEPTGQRVGTFKQIEGEVWLVRDGVRAPVRSGDPVTEAGRIQTGPGGAASVILKDGTVLTAGPETVMDLSRFQYDSTTQEGNFLLDLLQGSVRVVTGLLAKVNPERFKVQTPTSVVGVRGTDFIVEANPPIEPLHVYLRKHYKDHSRLRR